MKLYISTLILLSNIVQLNKLSRQIFSSSDYHLFNLQSARILSKDNQIQQKISKMPDQMIEIDGSILEGGGQIIRNAISLSALTEISIKIINIRAGRSKPGLMEQHLKGLELVRDICNGDLKGAKKGSTSIEFIPGKITGGNYISKVQTAGSISLLIQVALPCAIFANAPIYIQMQGGTNADFAPQIDYMDLVFKPNLEKMGASFNLELIRRGFFPRGGGKVNLSINPVKELQAIVMEDVGDIGIVDVFSFVINKDDVVKATKNVFGEDYQVEFKHEDTPNGNYGGIILSTKTNTGCVLGGSALQKQRENEKDYAVAFRAAKTFSETLKSKVCFDEHCQDQMILFMALANGTSRIKVGKELTLHTKTAIYVAELMTKAKFNVIECDNHSIIECSGIGLQNPRFVKN